MDLLFKREQSQSPSGGVSFRLWGKIELDQDEQAIIKRYKFDQAIMTGTDQPGLLRKSAYVGAAVAVGAFILLFQAGLFGGLIALGAGGGAGYWFYHQNRQTLYVKDFLHGRHINCDNVVDLARKEQELADLAATLRQVMESAKHWDGTERHTIDPLPKEDARRLIASR